MKQSATPKRRVILKKIARIKPRSVPAKLTPKLPDAEPKPLNDPLADLMPELNGAIVDVRRVTSFLLRSLIHAGSLLRSLRDRCGSDAEWLSLASRRFGLNSSEVHFLRRFHDRYASAADHLTPDVYVPLLRLVEMIGGVFANDDLRVKYTSRPRF